MGPPFMANAILNFHFDFPGTSLTQPLIPVRQSTRSQQFFLLHDIFPLFVFLLLFPSPNIFLLRFSSQKIFFSFLQFSSFSYFIVFLLLQKIFSFSKYFPPFPSPFSSPLQA